MSFGKVEPSRINSSAIEICDAINITLGFEILLLPGLQAGMDILPVIAAAILISDFLLDRIIITIPPLRS